MSCVFRFAQQVVFCVGTLFMLTGTPYAQAALPIPAPSMAHSGMPVDWSTQHVIYTRNGSVEDMLKVRDDPRFMNSLLLHYMREHSNQTAQPASIGLSEAGLDENRLGEDSSGDDTQELPPQPPWDWRKHHHTPPRKNKHSKRDWAVSLGPTAGMSLGETPAKYSFNPSAAPSCSDFVVFTIAASAAVGAQADLVGLTNLYSGTSPTGMCGTAPTFLFSYAIGAPTGLSVLSPVLSLDGTKVAWLENRLVTVSHITKTHAFLHVTTYVAGQGTNATGGSVAIGSGGSSDVAIDYTSVAHSGCSASVNSNTTSDLYVDYPSDTGYVSADNGILYHISGIFRGTPTFDFCIPVNTSVAEGAMSGAVYDEVLSPPEVFISDSQKLYAYSVGAASYTLAASKTYADGILTGPGPLLDAFNGYVYMFSAADTSGNTSMTQLPTSLASAVVVSLGPASTYGYPILLYGTFDNTYYNDGPFNSASTLYSCGADSTNSAAQDLFAIGFIPTTGVANTTPVMLGNTNINPGDGNGICSPIIEFFDGTKDRIFVGMGDFLTTGGASVVTMWDVTTQLTSASDTPTASATGYLGGTTGFTIDNNASGTAQAESVYFSTLLAISTTDTCGTGNYCAVKLTQSGLH
jgi:hypothetical protein